LPFKNFAMNDKKRNLIDNHFYETYPNMLFTNHFCGNGLFFTGWQYYYGQPHD